MAEHEIAIIGGGCIGLSISRHLPTDIDVCIIEKEHNLAQHQSGRNSGVLHPGFNYKPDSLKAELAVEGTKRAKDYAKKNDIPLYECGVLVVASNKKEIEELQRLKKQANKNGVKTKLIDKDRIKQYEPYTEGEKGLYAPEAASIDSQKFVYELAKDVEKSGVSFYMDHKVKKIEKGRKIKIKTNKGQIKADYIVNSAGLYADKLAHSLGIGKKYKVIPFRGDYFEITPSKSNIVKSMVYPAPDPELPFLGVHFTQRTDGKVIVGPNAALALAKEDYTGKKINISEFISTISYRGFWKLISSKKMIKASLRELHKSYSKKTFTEEAKNLIPDIEKNHLYRSYSGVRAQIVSNKGELISDPIILHSDYSTHILNAVSPGLTSSLPFGEKIAKKITEKQSE